jgi:hypothetical protein
MPTEAHRIIVPRRGFRLTSATDEPARKAMRKPCRIVAVLLVAQSIASKPNSKDRMPFFLKKKKTAFVQTRRAANTLLAFDHECSHAR